MPLEQSLWNHHQMSRSALLVWGGNTARATVRIAALLLQGISITCRALLRDSVVLSPCARKCLSCPEAQPGPWHSEQGVRPAEGCQQYRELNLVVLSLCWNSLFATSPCPDMGAETSQPQLR